MTEQEKLDEALGTISRYLRLFGLDNHLGYRNPQTLRLSAQGAETIAELLRIMTDHAQKRVNDERAYNQKWSA